MAKRSAVVIGAGIVGMATARSLASKGYDVTVVERSLQPAGASIRNFGMLWPVGQPDGELYELAKSSLRIWEDVTGSTGTWMDRCGSVHAAYQQDELEVLQEVCDLYRRRNYRMVPPAEACGLSPALVRNGLLGAMWSPEEMLVDPREAMVTLPEYLRERYNVRFIWGTVATDVRYPFVETAAGSLEADEIFVCSGIDFETLFPRQFQRAGITRCKLQMLRTGAQPANWRLGPAVCGGLSLLHYRSFHAARTLSTLRSRIEREYPEYLELGIHVMIAQHESGELTIGDSHVYGQHHDPFDDHSINHLILTYLQKFVRLPFPDIRYTWHGVYATTAGGPAYCVMNPEPGITIINGIGGAGMTLSFGLCEKIVNGLC